jgi:hypothetical protein
MVGAPRLPPAIFLAMSAIAAALIARYGCLFSGINGAAPASLVAWRLALLALLLSGAEWDRLPRGRMFRPGKCPGRGPAQHLIPLRLGNMPILPVAALAVSAWSAAAQFREITMRSSRSQTARPSLSPG